MSQKWNWWKRNSADSSQIVIFWHRISIVLVRDSWLYWKSILMTIWENYLLMCLAKSLISLQIHFVEIPGCLPKYGLVCMLLFCINKQRYWPDWTGGKYPAVHFSSCSPCTDKIPLPADSSTKQPQHNLVSKIKKSYSCQ